jgi:hypothetical protein
MHPERRERESRLDGSIEASIAALPADWQTDLTQLLSRQLAACASLHECAERQSELIASRRVEELMELMRERQAWVDELTETSRRLAPYREAWPLLLGRMESRERERTSELVRRIEATFEAVATRDARNRQRLEDEKQRLGDELAALDVGRAGARAYARASSGHETRRNRFMDQQG